MLIHRIEHEKFSLNTLFTCYGTARSAHPTDKLKTFGLWKESVCKYIISFEKVTDRNRTNDMLKENHF